MGAREQPYWTRQHGSVLGCKGACGSEAVGWPLGGMGAQLQRGRALVCMWVLGPHPHSRVFSELGLLWGAPGHRALLEVRPSVGKVVSAPLLTNKWEKPF